MAVRRWWYKQLWQAFHSASPDIYRGNPPFFFFFFYKFQQPCFCTFVRKGKTLKNTSRTASLWSETADKCSPTSRFYWPSIKHTTNSFVNWGFCCFSKFCCFLQPFLMRLFQMWMERHYRNPHINCFKPI